MSDIQAEQMAQEGLATGAENEKLLPQSQVNYIVQSDKEAAALKARREAEEEYAKKLEAIQQNGQLQQARNAEVPRQLDADAMYQQVQERFNNEMRERQVQDEMARVANSYLSKMSQGKELYHDFEDITKDFDATEFPQLVYLISGVENAPDVVYELAKNPSKLVTLNTLAKEAPKMAQAELLRVSRSIAENKLAQAEAGGQNSAAPLDRLKPSKVSGSNGNLSISELRNQSWLKG